MRNRAIPHPAADGQLELISLLAYHYRAEELRTQPITRQVHTFNRPSTSSGLDRNGSTYTVPYGAPAWAIVGGVAHWRLGYGASVDDVYGDLDLRPGLGLLLYVDLTLRSSADQVLVHIGDGTTTNNGITVGKEAGTWSVRYRHAAGLATQPLDAGLSPAVGTRLRLGAVLDGTNGRVRLDGSVGAGAWVVGAESGNTTIPTAWALNRIRLASLSGAAQVQTDLRAAKIIPFHSDYTPEDLELWV